MTVFCCELSCTACRAVVTRSSDTCVGPGAGGVVGGLSAQPSQPLCHSCLPLGAELRCHGSSLPRLLYLLIGHWRKNANTWAPSHASSGLETTFRARQAERRRSGLKVRPASQQASHFGISVRTCLSLLLSFFLVPLLSALSFCILWQPHCAHSFRCVNFAKVHECRKVRTLVSCPSLQLFIV